MAAYWRSPYREMASTVAHRRSPNHSTLKFEQSLHLSRARSSINFGRPDLFDPAVRSSTADNNSNNNNNNNNINLLYRPEGLNRSQTNATIKSILKPAKPQRSNSVPNENNNDNIPCKDADKENEIVEPLKKDKKKVRFGGSQRVILHFDTDNTVTRSHARLENNALKRLSHSRLIEETAMKKLNRLISGVTSDKSSALPSVKGKGLLSQSHSNDVYSSSRSSRSCQHSSDLRCIRCIKKDVETNDSDSIFGNENNPDLKISRSVILSGDKVKSKSMNEDVIKSAENQLGSVDNVQCRSPVHSGSRSSKRHFRLLPGRYPFTSGAMQIKKLLVTDQNNDQNVGNPNPESVLQSNTVDLHLERAMSQVSSNYYLRANSSRSPSPRMNNIISHRTVDQNSQSSRNNPPKMPVIPTVGYPNDQPQANTSVSRILNDNESRKENVKNEVKLAHVTDNNINSQTVFNDAALEAQTPTSTLGDEPPKNKTSEILEWLNDVQRNQALPTPTHQTQAITVESQ